MTDGPDDAFRATADAVRAALAAQGFMQHVGAEVDEVSPGRVVLSVQRRDVLLQQHGFFHGGVIAFLVDNATTAAAGTCIDRSTQACLTAEYKLNIVSPARGQRLRCDAEVVKPGRRLAVVQARVHCDAPQGDVLVAIALATIAVLPRADLQAARR